MRVKKGIIVTAEEAVIGTKRMICATTQTLSCAFREGCERGLPGVSGSTVSADGFRIVNRKCKVAQRMPYLQLKSYARVNLDYRNYRHLGQNRVRACAKQYSPFECMRPATIPCSVSYPSYRGPFLCALLYQTTEPCFGNPSGQSSP
jgi:hypothetical protein